MADIFAAQVRVADDVVDGLWSGDDAFGYPGTTSEYYAFQLTQAQHAALSAAPLFWGGADNRPKWKIVSNALTEQADTRRLVVFNPALVVTAFQNNATVPVQVQVRQLPPNESQVDTSINGDFDVRVLAKGPGVESLWCRVTIAAGVGQILIDKEIIKEAVINDQGVFRVDEPLRVRVLAPGRF